jgi:hypothetical protein
MIGLTGDTMGNIYVSDTEEHRVRVILATTGTIMTFAGTGQPSSSGDGGFAIYAGINYPNGLFIQTDGVMYVAEGHGHAIRKIDANYIITTIAGTLGIAGNPIHGIAATSSPLNHPVGIFVRNDILYISSSGNHRVVSVDLSNSVLSYFAGDGGTGSFDGDEMRATSASLNSPLGITGDSIGNIYIADSQNLRIRMVSYAGLPPITTPGVIITVVGDGNGRYFGDGTAATAASIHYPTAIAFDTAGNLYIADRLNDAIRKVDTANIISTIAINVQEPYSMWIDSSSQYLYFSETNLVHDILRVDLDTLNINLFAANGSYGFSGDNGPATEANFAFIRGVSGDTIGNIYISDSDNNRVRKVSATTGIVTTVIGSGFWESGGDGGPATSASLAGPSGLFITRIGEIFVVEHFGHCVRKVDTNGIISTIAGIPGVSGDPQNGLPATGTHLFHPNGIYVYGYSVFFSSNSWCHIRYRYFECHCGYSWIWWILWRWWTSYIC